MANPNNWLTKRDTLRTGRLRPDFYNILLPEIIEEDQKGGTFAFLDTYDDPEAEINAWDQTAPFQAVWDRTGILPVLQRLFWVLEEQHGNMLVELDDMEVLTDPDQCPVEFLPRMAASLGYDMEDGLSEKEQRELIKGLMDAFHHHGTPISWTVFYRMLGYRIIAYPLWKKELAEDQDRYDRDRYVTTTPFGPWVLPGAFTGSLTQAPLRPRSIVILDAGGETFRDDGKGNLLGSKGGTGTINYLIGTINLSFAPPGPTAPILLWAETVNEEYPYHAARVDLDFFLIPIGGGTPPVVDDEFVKKVLWYLEEVRPIHVLIRTFNLIMEMEDDGPDVTDGNCCGPDLGVDYWDALQDWYIGDVGPFGKDGGLHISRSDGQEQEHLEDVTPFIHPLAGDPLVITSSPTQPFDGWY
jgi:hypothetical protein